MSEAVACPLQARAHPPGGGLRALRAGRASTAGFTLVELVVVIVLVTLLGGFVVGRFIDREPAAVQTTADRLVSSLRLAQVTAQTQRRTVCLAFTKTPAALQVGVVSAAGSTNCATQALIEPPGGGSWLGETGYLSLSSTPVLSFGADGTPLDAAGVAHAAALTLQVQGSTHNSATIVIAPGSGHVYTQ